MKKTYIEPKTTLVFVELQTMIAASLKETGDRNVTQEDYDTTNPTVVGNRENSDEDSDDHTVGGGAINRAKTGMIWDEW